MVAAPVFKKKKKKKCVIEDVIQRHRSRVEPIFVKFANGRPCKNAELNGILHQKASKDCRQQRRVLTLETRRLDYAGKDFGTEASQMYKKQYVFLGILNKATGKMRLVETSSFCVSPLLKPVETTNVRLSKTLNSMTNEEKQEAAASAFGTKRAQQYINRKKQYKEITQNMSEAIGQAATSAILKLSEFEEKRAETTFLSILPECNREASQLEDVYSLEAIAPDNFLLHLAAFARGILEGKDPQPKSSALFQELLESAKLEKDEENRIRLTCVAVYVEYLVNFLKLRRREIQDLKTQEKTLKGCPLKIKHYILNEYSQIHYNKRVRSTHNEDSATCCVLILSLIVMKYKLLVNTLLQSLPITRDRLNILMKVVGATYVAEKHSYVLKIPLAKFPQPHMKKKQYGKKTFGNI